MLSKPSLFCTAVLALTVSGFVFSGCARQPATPKPMPIRSPGPPVKGIINTVYALQYVDIKVGTGPAAEPGRKMTMHYTGWLKDSTKFDSSFDRNEPIEIVLGSGRVIKGWDHGLVGMRVGGKRRLLIPYQLAYGEKGRNPIPPKSDLIFDVELVAMDTTALGPVGDGR